MSYSLPLYPPLPAPLLPPTMEFTSSISPWKARLNAMLDHFPTIHHLKMLVQLAHAQQTTRPIGLARVARRNL